MTSSSSSIQVLATNETSSTAEQAVQNYLAFKALALAQQDQVDQIQLTLAEDALLTGFVDVLTDVATETGDAELLQALDLMRQTIKSGNYQALPEAFATLGSSLPNLPLTLQMTMMQAMGPGLANACQPLNSGQVSLATADEALQLFAQLEAAQPGSTGQIIPLLTEARNQVETRNQLFTVIRDNLTTGGEFVATTLEAFGQAEAAQQLRTYTQTCQGNNSANDLTPTVSGTMGHNGWYIDDVTVSWSLQPDWGIVSGCQPTVISVDTPGRQLTCLVITADSQLKGGQVTIKRDATPPVLELVSPSQNPASANEGSTLLLEALAQDATPVTVGWDLDEDGTIDAPNPTSITIPGLQGSVVPNFIATDEAGNVSQIEVAVSVINLAPNIDGWVVPTMLHFGGLVPLSATTSDPGNDPLTAGVDWGDGSEVEAVVVNPDGSLQAGHQYEAGGTYQVTLTLSDDEGLTDSDSQDVWIYTPGESIEIDLIPDTRSLCDQGILSGGQCDSLVVKLEGALVALDNDRPAAPEKLTAYLNELEGVVSDAIAQPVYQIATDVRDGLILQK